MRDREDMRPPGSGMMAGVLAVCAPSTLDIALVKDNYSYIFFGVIN